METREREHFIRQLSIVTNVKRSRRVEIKKYPLNLENTGYG
jgi:hypothetical protein